LSASGAAPANAPTGSRGAVNSPFAVFDSR